MCSDICPAVKVGMCSDMSKHVSPSSLTSVLASRLTSVPTVVLICVLAPRVTSVPLVVYICSDSVPACILA